MRRRLAVLAAATAFLTCSSIAFAPARPAAAADGLFTGLDSFDADYAIQPDGSVRVHEVLVARFIGTGNHGINRYLTVEQPYRKQANRNRVYRVSDISVTASPGFSADFTTSRIEDTLRIRIGSERRTFGSEMRPTVVTYTIDYALAGALNHFTDHDELNWNVTGSKWRRINRTAITEQAPAAVTAVRCFAGPPGSLDACKTAQIDDDGAATFEAGLLLQGGVTTVIAFPSGAVSPPPTPTLRDTTWDWVAGAGLTVPNLAGFLLLFALLVGWMPVVIIRRGRDRQSKGGAVDQAFSTAPSPGGDERVPYRTGGEIPVEFVPPENLRPAQMGLLVKEASTPLGVSATIVDLAVRGYVRIAEVPSPGIVRKHPNYELTILNQDYTALQPYEAMLLSNLVSFGNPVYLAELRSRFSGYSDAVRNAVTDDALTRGWFAADPAKARRRFTTYALILAAISIFGFGFAVGSGVPWIVFLAFPLAALIAFVLARFAPARTAAGTAAYRRVLGFRRFITESEKYRAQFAEKANLFTEYLPYAVMFGATAKWAKTFKDLGLPPPDTDAWFVGSSAFAFDTFSSSLDDFSSSSASDFSASASSGGDGDSGFGGDSGGSDSGGGGGGGDGW